MPPDVSDPAGEATYHDMESCVRLPLLHCAFEGCRCDVSRGIYCSKLYHWQLEIAIYEHITKVHSTEMEEVTEWIRRKGLKRKHVCDEVDVFVCTAAVMELEREHMPLVGPYEGSADA